MRLYDRVTVLNDNPEQNLIGTVVGTASYCVDDRDFTTMDGVGTMRTEYVVKLDYNYQGWVDPDEDGYNGKAFISHLIVHEDGLEPAPWYVNAYEEDRGYGGPEEGGWWYDSRENVHTKRFDTKREAEVYAESIRDEYPENGEYPISSVCYNGGAHSIIIENCPPVNLPENTPHYE